MNYCHTPLFLHRFADRIGGSVAIKGLQSSGSRLFVRPASKRLNETIGRFEALELDEASGILQIHGLLTRVPYELAWIYLPQSQLWLSATISANKSQVDVWGPDAKELGDETLVFYHIHPNLILKGFKEDYLKRNPISNRTLIGNVADSISAWILAVPSIAPTTEEGDIWASLRDHNSYPLGRVKFRIISSIGVVEWAFGERVNKADLIRIGYAIDKLQDLPISGLIKLRDPILGITPRNYVNNATERAAFMAQFMANLTVEGRGSIEFKFYPISEFLRK